MFRKCFFVFLVLNALTLAAQVADTIIIVDAPVVIHKQVVITENVKTKPSFKDIYIGLGSTIGKYNSYGISDSVSVHSSNFISPTLRLGKKIQNKWDLSIGYASNKNDLNASYKQSYQKEYEVNLVHNDTVGKYSFLLPDGSTKTIYTIISTPYKDTITENYDSTFYVKGSLNYRTIPLFLAYTFSYKKFYFQPLIGLSYTFTNQKKFFENSFKTKIVSSFLSSDLGINFGYIINDKLETEIGYVKDFQLSNISNNLAQNKSRFRIQLKYIFNSNGTK